MIAVRTLCARRKNAGCALCACRKRAVTTLQQLLAHRSKHHERYTMETLLTLLNVVWALWGHCEDVVYTP